LSPTNLNVAVAGFLLHPVLPATLTVPFWKNSMVLLPFTSCHFPTISLAGFDEHADNTRTKQKKNKANIFFMETSRGWGMEIKKPHFLLQKWGLNFHRTM